MERGRPKLRSTGGCIKNDLERDGERGRDDRQNELEAADRERFVRKERGRKRQWKINYGQLTPDDSDAKKIITTKYNLTLVQ